MADPVAIEDLKLCDLAGAIALTFTCPRCGAVNKTVVDAADIVWGSDIHCQNKACGGPSMFEFTFDLGGYGWRKSLSDVPLIAKDKPAADPALRDVLLVVTRRKRTLPSDVAKELGIPVKEAQRRLRLLADGGALERIDVFYSAKVPYVEVS